MGKQRPSYVEHDGIIVTIEVLLGKSVEEAYISSELEGDKFTEMTY